MPQETVIEPNEKEEKDEQDYDAEEIKEFEELEYEPDKNIEVISDYSFNSTREHSVSEKELNGNYGNSCGSSNGDSEEFTKDVDEKLEEELDQETIEFQLMKEQKQIKIKTLEQSWQKLCQNGKRVYK